MSYYDGKWNLSTNGMHDAFVRKFPNVESFGEQFAKYFTEEYYLQMNWDNVKDYTHVFTLTANALYYITSVNKKTLNEYKFNFNSFLKTQFPKISYEEFHKMNTGMDDKYQFVLESIVNMNNDPSNNNNSYVYRYLYPSKLLDYIIYNIIHSKSDNNEFKKSLSPTSLELYNTYSNKVTNMYTFLLNKYWNSYTKHEYIKEPHILNVLKDIHLKEYLNYLKSRKQSIQLNNIIHYFKNYSNTRDIIYILNDIDLLSKSK